MKADSNVSSGTGRKSHANAGRSTITLSGKPMEGTESSVNGPIICPLQGYLFGTSMGMPETIVPKKEKKTSLGELFKKPKWQRKILNLKMR